MSKKVNILLVDDRPEGLVALESVLNEPDYNLVLAESGQEALAQVLSHDFAVILMDVQMPDMDGFETASIIKQRERSRNIPIIFMTANNKADHYISVGYSVGAVDYVLKPFDPHILRSKVSVFVDLFRKTQLLQEQADALREVERREQLRTIHDLEVEGRRRYQNLADAIPQIVFKSTVDGHIDYFNQFWLQYSGKTLLETNGDQWKKLIHPEDIAIITEKWKTSKRNRKGFDCEARILQGSSQDHRWHILKVVPEFNAVSELVSWIGTATDIHDQKMSQQELLRAKKLADAASETKSNFLANMSHEIRTPLGIVLGFSELLVDPETAPDEKLNAIKTIRRNGEQLSKIIDEILDLSKVEAGKMDMKKSEMQILPLIQEIREFMALPAKEKSLELDFSIKGKVPGQIVSSATRIQQILVNLIGNAIKFSPQGKVEVILSYPKDQILSIAVKDCGPGLTQEQIDSLFQPFTQVDTSMTRKHGGTGLGLALSRRLARALGGDIQVEGSKPGQGCEFVLTIPTGPVDTKNFVEKLEEAEALEKAQDAGKKNSALKGVRVLLVEDSVDNQMLVSRFLTMEGAKVDIANNGLEGVDKAMAGDHDVVLMDIQMPELDGYGAISRLRQGGFGKPIIALTAHGMIEDKQRCLRVGSSSHLTKPVNRGALIERVQQFSNSHR